MVEAIVGLYGLVCWLVFVRLKLVPVTTYTVCTAIFGMIIILLSLYIMLSVYHPSSDDGRLYAPVVQIVPQVRGRVIEVPVEANKPIKKGDVLFKIDPQPYQIEVDRLRASLAAKNSKFAQLAEQLAAAEADTRQARADLQVSESKFDRQLRETYEQAKAEVLRVKERAQFAKQQFDRAKEGFAKNIVSEQEFQRNQAQYDTQAAALLQAEGAERLAAEQLRTGSASLEAARQEVAQTEAAERKVRTEFNAQIDGQNPEVRETMALLEKARWDLDQTVVRAPTDGYVPQVLIRPGMMAVPMPLKPLMAFVVDERPVLIASFPQKVIPEFKPDMHGEATFKQYPGRTFKVKIRRVLTAIPEGELDASGQLVSPTAASEHGHIPVIFDYEDDVAGLNLPVGAQATVAVYTDRVHALSFLRRIILRIHAWENYVF